MALIAAGTNQQRMQQPPVHRGLDQRRCWPVEERARELNELADLAHMPAGGEMEGGAHGLRRLTEREDRICHVVDRHHIHRRVSARRHRCVGSAGERAQWPVENVERCRPTALALAHHDARTYHRHREQRAPARDEALSLELRLLVGVAKTLADVEVVLAEAPRVLAGDKGRGDVREAS